MHFVKQLQKAHHHRRYTIESSERGWEVRQEQDREVVREACYQDWHRVERAHRAFVIEVNSLRDEGWQEV